MSMRPASLEGVESRLPSGVTRGAGSSIEDNRERRRFGLQGWRGEGLGLRVVFQRRRLAAEEFGQLFGREAEAEAEGDRGDTILISQNSRI